MKVVRANITFDHTSVETKEEIVPRAKYAAADTLPGGDYMPTFAPIEALKAANLNGIAVPFHLVKSTIPGEFIIKTTRIQTGNQKVKTRPQLLTSAILPALDGNLLNAEKTIQGKVIVNMNTQQHKHIYELSLPGKENDNSYLVEIISVFLNESMKEINEMLNGITGNRPDIIIEQAQKLKNRLGNVQSNQLYSVLTEIEETTTPGKLTKDLIALVQEALQQYKKIQIALQRQLRSMQP